MLNMRYYVINVFDYYTVHHVQLWQLAINY